MEKHNEDVGAQQRVLSVAEFVRLTHLGRNTIYQACRQGTIPCIRIGRRLLIPADALDRMLHAHSQETPK